MIEFPKNVEIEEAAESSHLVIGQKFDPGAVEEAPTGGVRGSGHGLEVSPGSLLDESIFYGDFPRGRLRMGRGVGPGRANSRRG